MVFLLQKLTGFVNESPLFPIPALMPVRTRLSFPWSSLSNPPTSIFNISFYLIPAIFKMIPSLDTPTPPLPFQHSKGTVPSTTLGSHFLLHQSHLIGVAATALLPLPFPQSRNTYDYFRGSNNSLTLLLI